MDFSCDCCGAELQRFDVVLLHDTFLVDEQPE